MAAVPTLFFSLRFGFLNVLMAAFIVALLLGGGWIWLVYGLALFGIAVLDESIGAGGESEIPAGKWIYEIQLYATLPLLILMTILFLHYLTDADPVGLMAGLSRMGLTFGGSASQRDAFAILGATFATGFFFGVAGMTVGHELLHRTDSAIARHVARILLAFNNNGHYATYHLYGHHRNVATFDDPASAHRGEYVIAFAFRCYFSEIRQALRIEKARLRKKGLPHVSWHNRVLQGQLYSVALIAAVMAIAGYRGLIAFVIAASFGTGIQRIIDYVQHYGLVRVPEAPVEARHSWQCDHLLTGRMQYNLALHPDHHLNGGKPYWELRPKSDAPRIPCGYTAAVLVALALPLWRRMIDPLLADWDQRLANDAERTLVRQLYPSTALSAKTI